MGDTCTLPKNLYFTYFLFMVHNFGKGSRASLPWGDGSQSLTEMIKCPQWNLQRNKATPMLVVEGRALHPKTTLMRWFTAAMMYSMVLLVT